MNFITSSYYQSANASTSAFERLFLEDVLVPKEGYMFIYVSNQEEQANIAYFDDITIEHKHSPVLQSDDYYPFGLTFNSYQRSYSKANNFKYNGKEKQEEWDVLDYGFRMYDPAIARWSVQDAHAESYHSWSPYNYVMNNPINMIDLLGLDPVYRDGKYYETNDNGEEYEVQWSFVEKWLQGKDHIGASYSFESSGSGTTITETKKGKTNSFTYNGQNFTSNSMKTLMGRDDRNNSIGDFSGIETLDGLALENILGHATSIFYDMYNGNVELAVLSQSLGGMLDYKKKLYDILSIDDASLIEINGTTYNANEAGNFLWGMVITYAGGLISPNMVAELGTRGRNDESWEQKAITSGSNYALELLKRDDNFKRKVLSQRLQFRAGEKQY